MALGTITVTQKVKQGPIHADHLSFAGDGAYPAGGTVDFEGLYRNALEAAGASSPGREVLAVIQVDASGHVLRYDKANDKLVVLVGDNDAVADGPLVEVAAASNLSGTTFKAIVLSI